MRLLIVLILWCLLLAVCWPLALLVLAASPFVLVIALVFGVLALAAEVLFVTLRELLLLPARVLSWPFHRERVA
jgi:hypothetical protein